MKDDLPDLRPTLATLAELFPAAFTKRPCDAHRPLAIGTTERLVELGVLTLEEARRALRFYSSRLMYQRCLAAGGARYALEGSVAGEVTADQAKGAALCVGNIERRRAERAAAIKAEKKAARTGAKAKASKAASPATPVPAPLKKGDGLAALRQAARARKQADTNQPEQGGAQL